MMFQKSWLVIILAVGLWCPASAHDVWGLANPKMPPEAQINEADLAKLAHDTPDPDARYVFERALIWTPGKVLAACFIGGSDTQRQAVRSAVHELLDGTNVNVKIDFGADPAGRPCVKDGDGTYPEDIRVSLQDGCCSANIGTSSHSKKVWSGGYVIAQNPSVFLEGTSDKVTIKHEIIHALGFHHEHQKPDNLCEFDYAAIQAAYGWSADKVKTNFDRLNKASNRYVYSNTFDEASIMKYYFDPSFLKGGTGSPCYSKQATDLSDWDWLGLRTAYPMVFDVAQHRRRMKTKAASIDPVVLSSNPLVADVIKNVVPSQ